MPITTTLGSFRSSNGKAERTRNLRIAKKAAEESSRTKSAFLANMSPEIRTPLGAIMGFTDLLKDAEFDRKERENFLEIIHRNGKALTRIINNILDLAKVEAGRLDFESMEFSLSDLMLGVVELFRDKVRLKDIFVLLKVDPRIVSVSFQTRPGSGRFFLT